MGGCLQLGRRCIQSGMGYLQSGRGCLQSGRGVSSVRKVVSTERYSVFGQLSGNSYYKGNSGIKSFCH